MYAPIIQQPGWTPPAAELPFYRLKSKQEELGNQLESVTDRREDLIRELQNSRSGVERDGIEARVKGLDARILQLETDLAAVGKEIAEQAPASLTVPPPRVVYRGYGDEDVVGGGVAGFFIALTLCIPLFVRAFRRRRYVPPGTASTAMSGLGSERMDRMESAIDSIAIEMERVSENQRFMTRLMTETQLAGTIAAVRGSAEAAKVAAETANNA